MITQFCPLVKDYFQKRHFFKTSLAREVKSHGWRLLTARLKTSTAPSFPPYYLQKEPPVGSHGFGRVDLHQTKRVAKHCPNGGTQSETRLQKRLSLSFDPASVIKFVE